MLSVKSVVNRLHRVGVAEKKSKQQNISEVDSSATANKKLLVSAGLVSLNAEISK